MSWYEWMNGTGYGMFASGEFLTDLSDLMDFMVNEYVWEVKCERCVCVCVCTIWALWPASEFLRIIFCSVFVIVCM